MHCNLRQPDVALSLSALISSPVSSSKSLSLSVAVLERFYCLYVTLRYDIELQPVTLTFELTFDLEPSQCIACDVMKLCAKFERNRTIHGGVIAL